MTNLLRVLLVEDWDDDAQLVVRELRRNGYDVVFERIETLSAMQQALIDKSWDIIICDYSLPQFDAMQALQVLKESGLDIPFIIVSGTIDEEHAVAALKAGANDFLVKGKFARLIPAVVRELREAELRRAHKRAEEQIKFHARLLRHVNDAVIATDTEFRITAWNRAAERIYGWTAAEVMGRNADAVLKSGFSREQQAEAQQLLREESAYRSERIHSTKNGKPVYVEENAIALTDERGKITGYVSVNRDITERKQAEIQILQQMDQLSALWNIDQAIMSNFDLRYTLNLITSEVSKQLRVDAVDILLLDSESGMLEYAAGKGFRTPTIETSRVPLGKSHAGRVARNGRPIKIENLEEATQDPLFATLFAQEHFAFYCGVPLIAKGKTKGVLEVFHRAPRQPKADWLNFLNLLAGQAAIALDNATLFENLQQTNEELRRAYDTTIEGWSRALDLRDRETKGHTLRVTEMTLTLAGSFGFGEEEMVHIRRGALLHDIGKMGVPDSILLKPGALTPVEWTIMRQHPLYAYELLRPIVFLVHSLDIPYCHHEKWDGSGYPRGLSADETPLAARLFAVVDVWDALISDRPYRPAWSPDQALTYIREQSGRHFDPQVVEAFFEIVD
ncbi:MAG TPA: HD domain-containing phosphohydrolase [Anaerolineales bacterium]|nr:HD domain-containing phosphohydrolase [Anaerolineales bacterium]